LSGREAGGWPRRFWRHLGSASEEPDRIVRLIIAERLIKSAGLFAGAVALVWLGRTGALTRWIQELNDQLNLSPGRDLFVDLLARTLDYVVRLPHQVLLAGGLVLYAALETTEGIGLWLRRRWAEYLTVLATSVGIPFELYEVAHRATPFKVGALVVNVAIVVYLAWRKRLFVGV
jgi:uncharacterized membrane protein (DUF2068 family)